MDPDGGFVAAFERRRRRDLWEEIVELVLEVLAGFCLGLLVVLLSTNVKLSRNLDKKEMQLAKASAVLLHREAELARANLLWTQVQVAEARGRSDFLGSGEAGRSPPSRSYSYGPTTNAQVVPFCSFCMAFFFPRAPLNKMDLCFCCSWHLEKEKQLTHKEKELASTRAHLLQPQEH
ncbi:uncharacterized protein [Setaria viridis]|uniref:uncharacterized protein isoform X1 n=1 Tax=Setaria viridis TaxID=4556 RepID=UPI003B3B9DD6